MPIPMAKRRRKADGPTPISETLPEVMEQLPAEAPDTLVSTPVLEAPPPQEERVRPTGPSGGQRNSRSIPVGNGKIYFTVDPQFNQTQIWFDDSCAPDRDTKDWLEERGYHYRSNERKWLMQRGEDKFAATEYGQRVFRELGDRLRAEAGLPAIQFP